MPKKSASALIVAKPGRRRDSLRAMLKAVPRLRIVGQVDDGPSALMLLHKNPVKLILLDCDLSNDKIWTILQQVKTKSPQTRSLVLVDTVQQQQMAQAAGADDILVSGFSIAHFLLTVERLLAENHTTHQKDGSTQPTFEEV